jgi:DNA-binding MarR family transcriptional regulator
MADATRDSDADQTRIVLGLLDQVERDGTQSQRHLASELGIALGLVNAYLKRCIKKGLIKVSAAPARRYAYYLTPQGFVEKSRLTVEYLSYSFGFFRQAKSDYSQLFEVAKQRNLTRVVLAGRSDLAEIASLCAIQSGVEIVAIVDATASDGRFVGHDLAPSFDAVARPFDAVIVTDLMTARETCDAVIAQFGLDRVFIPDLLRVRISAQSEASS